MTPRVVLASTSAGRAALLDRLGLRFDREDPGVDEDAIKAVFGDPVDLAANLARAKAEAVAQRVGPDAITIGGDQLVALEGEILGKPGSATRAVEQLLAMAGRAHRLVTAVAVAHQDDLHTHVDVTTLQMRVLSRGELTRYVERDHPVDCAGAYRIERAGIALFDRIESADHTAIVGLPMLWLTGVLRDLGVPLP